MSKNTESPFSGISNIVHVLESGFPAVGGAEGQAATLSHYLCSKGIVCTVLVPMVDMDFSLDKEYDELGDIKIRRIKYPKIPLLGSVFLLTKLVIYLLVNRKKYDALHIHIANNMAAIACLIASWLGKTTVVKFTGWQEIENGVLNPSRQDLRIRFLRWCLNKANFYHAISNTIVEKIGENGFDQKKTVLLPNAVDTARFKNDSGRVHELRQSLNLENKLVGIYVGRLEKVKAVDSLIDAWEKYFSNREDVALLLVGNGELEKELRQQVISLGLQDNVQFIGFKKDVENYLSLADFGVLPSEYEGLSNTLLEYFSASLPVIGSRVSGTKDIVSHGKTGWLFEPRDIDALIENLKAVDLSGKEKLQAMGQDALTWITEYSGLESVCSRLVKLYKNEQGDNA
ncbi:glycosyltransferase family 4 protein [Aliikangiella sp. IMCC44359]|uniref:glycosyltransferase family 4 protein n=1 Tax=Aliikangiella sp. IMCC44359 TaxID=3459125 RepID=UPI00403B06B8